MPRTTDAQVRKVITVPAAMDLTEHMRAAANLVDALCEPEGVYTEAELTDIETWLAAHFASLDPAFRASEAGAGPLIEKEIDGARKRYANVMAVAARAVLTGKDLGLKETPWGRQALVLDRFTFLAFANQKAMGPIRKVSVRWSGTPHEDL